MALTFGAAVPPPARAVVTVNVGSTSGNAGWLKTFSVALDTGGASVAGVEHRITFDSVNTPIAKTAAGKPSCTVNPAIGKSGYFGLLPDLCDGSDCNVLKITIVSLGDVATIPTGQLYSCDVQISATATLGDHPLTVSDVRSGDPGGGVLSSTGTSGVVTVTSSGGCNISTVRTSPTQALFLLALPLFFQLIRSTWRWKVQQLLLRGLIFFGLSVVCMVPTGRGLTLDATSPLVYSVRGSWSSNDQRGQGTWEGLLAVSGFGSFTGHLTFDHYPKIVSLNVVGSAMSSTVQFEALDPATDRFRAEFEGQFLGDDLTGSLMVVEGDQLSLEGHRTLEPTGPHVDEGIAERLAAGEPQDAFIVFAYHDILAAARVMREEGATEDDIAAFRTTAFSTRKDDALAQASRQITPLQDYASFPTLLVRINDLTALKALIAAPNIVSIAEIPVAKPTLAESLPLIHVVGPTGLRLFSFTGSGADIAVVDYAVDFRDSTLFGTCTSPGAPSTCKVKTLVRLVAGDTFVDKDGHGTNSAGIALAVAPDAKIISLDVTKSQTCSNAAATNCFFDGDCPSGGFCLGLEPLDTPSIQAAAQWVLYYAASNHIAAVNYSLQTNLSTTPCPNSVFTPLFLMALDQGIVSVAAAGNAGPDGTTPATDQIAEPACSPYALSVGGVYDNPNACNGFCQADQVIYNTAPFLRMVAPGSFINLPDGGTANGTSAAAAFVSGAVAVLREAFPDDPARCIMKRLYTTGDPVTDNRGSGAARTFPRLDVLNAVNTAPTFVADCNGDKRVAINEIITAVTISLGLQGVGVCPRADVNGNSQVSISELIMAINSATVSCPLGPFQAP